MSKSNNFLKNISGVGTKKLKIPFSTHLDICGP